MGTAPHLQREAQRKGRGRRPDKEQGRQRPQPRLPEVATVIMETSAVVEVLGARRAGRRPPGWFEASRDAGRLAVPRTVEVELKRLRKSNRRGAGSRAEMSWLARLGGRDMQWVYDLYREAPIDSGVLARIERMHGEAVRDRGGAAARSWLRSKRSFVRGRLGYGGAGRPLEDHQAGRALAALNRAAANDRAIMAQAVAIATAAAAAAAAAAAPTGRGAQGGGGGGGGPGGGVRPAAALVSRDGDFTAFAGRLEEISGGTMRTVHYSRM